MGSMMNQAMDYYSSDTMDGNLVIGMMAELKPYVRSGFQKFCTALFDGDPTISDAVLAKNAKVFVDIVEVVDMLSLKRPR